MKTKKIVIIATFLTFAVVSSLNAGSGSVSSNNKPSGKVIELTLQQALSNLGLAAAIYKQVSLEEVLNSPALTFTAKVVYQNYIFQVTGLHDQWISFFKMYNQVGSSTSSNTVKVK